MPLEEGDDSLGCPQLLLFLMGLQGFAGHL